MAITIVENRWFLLSHLVRKLKTVSWIYLLFIVLLAGVGYVCLLSAGGGDASVYANKHLARFAFGLVLALAVSLVNLRVLAMISWLYTFSRSRKSSLQPKLRRHHCKSVYTITACL